MIDRRRIVTQGPPQDRDTPDLFRRGLALLALCLVACFASGCSSYFARRITQAPNRYPSWLAPGARVVLDYDGAIATNLPSKYVDVGPPEARLRYRVVPAGDYAFKVSATNEMEHGRSVFKFSFNSNVVGLTNEFTKSPRGTVVLLHGYGLGEYAMLPWAFQLAQDGWRCVLVDLRGHGKSTGKQISYGIHECQDLSQLLDALERDGHLSLPVAAVGVSYGAALALRWKGREPRVGPIVAIAPYAVLSNAVINICREYAPYLPLAFPRSGLKKVPSVLGVEPDELDPVAVLRRQPVKGLLIAANDDQITSWADMKRLEQALAPGSRLIVIPRATHETVAYRFPELAPLVQDWLDNHAGSDDKAAVVR
jgi:pimeloyl-ACP methyl ester carboxylesterase